MPSSSTSDQGFRWRAWPCPQCNQGITPVGQILRRSETSSALVEGSPEELAQAQSNELVKWVEICPHTSFQHCNVPFLAQGSEHAVYLDAERADVFKLTLPGTFGEYYYLVEGLVNQEKCTPFQYLLRLHFWEEIFGSSPRAIGITPQGQIVSQQAFISGTTPTQEEVDQYLIESGLNGIKISCWLWSRSYEGFDIWVGDARSDNFVKTSAGMVPIDLRVWLASIIK